MSLKVTVQRSSNVFKGVPGVWHTISSIMIGGVKETVTTRIVESNQSEDWMNIENGENYHWLQVRDTAGFRNWVQMKYETLLGVNIPQSNFLIVDLKEAKSQLYPKTFRCPNCSRLSSVTNERELQEQVIYLNRLRDTAPNLGLRCQYCQRRPITQQPHVLIDYTNGRITELPTTCPNCNSALQLDFRGSAVSIHGWRLSCTSDGCILHQPRDPYALNATGEPYFRDFFFQGRRLSISPSTRGPSRSIVDAKIDTSPFRFKPDNCLLASLFLLDQAPSFSELKSIMNSMRTEIANRLYQALNGQQDLRICMDMAENLHRGNDFYDQALSNLESDSEFSRISERSDIAGTELNEIFIDFGVGVDELQNKISEIRHLHEEPINLMFSEGLTYEEYVSTQLTSNDPRVTSLSNINSSLEDLQLTMVKYIYPGDIGTESSDDCGFQIIKASFCIDNGLVDGPIRIPFHQVQNSRFNNVRSQDGPSIQPDDNHPIIYSTNWKGSEDR